MEYLHKLFGVSLHERFLSFLPFIYLSRVCAHVCLVVSDSLGPHGLELARLLCLWNFPGISTGVPTPVNLFHYSFMEVDSETFVLHSGYNSVLL